MIGRDYSKHRKLSYDRHNINEAHRGWDSSFAQFSETSKSVILRHLRDRYPDSSTSETNSWQRTVPDLQREIGEVIEVDLGSSQFTAVLEYELPMESRRADAVLLLHDNIVVIELKGKSRSTDADIDQAHAYARDLRCYHRDCHDREVIPILVPQLLRNHVSESRNVKVCSPDRLDELVAALGTRHQSEPVDAQLFLKAEAYKPLPSLVRAARELFNRQKPPQLWRSVADTDQAVVAVRNIVADAFSSKRRKLVLLMGVPGAGKTLVGLRIVHEADLDTVAARDTGPSAIFLSGNGPLVEVLQYVLKTEQDTGSTFVRPIKEYVRRYTRNHQLIPNEHVMIFDEAQRAHDRDRVAEVHKIDVGKAVSEPENFVNFAERVPGWSVVVGLVGHGQEIHIGEEGGLKLWADAINKSLNSSDWDIHGPKETTSAFQGLSYQISPDLSLNENIRSHFASYLHEFVSKLVANRPNTDELYSASLELERQGHDLRITRNLETAKQYLRQRYKDWPQARFGMVASSRDKELESFGVPNGFQDTKRVKVGPWYNDDEDLPTRLSCRHLEVCVTEFAAQGLELDAVLLAWGTDFQLQDGQWSIAKARKYRSPAQVKNPLQIRSNAYRVLLTRGRDAHVVFVPELRELDETWELLCSSGFRKLMD